MQQNSRPPPFPPPLLPSPSLPVSSLYPSPLSPSPLPPISHTLPLFIILFPLFTPLPSLLLFTGSVSFSLSFPEGHVSLLALHTITSIHQLSAYSSLATPLPFLHSMTTTPTTLHTRFFATPPFLTPHLSGQLSVTPHTLGLVPLLLLSLPPKLTPPVAPLSHARCP